MSVYGHGALSAYGMAPVKDAATREHDAKAFSRGVFWIVWIYFHDRSLVWA